jgi:hypothetical protein
MHVDGNVLSVDGNGRMALAGFAGGVVLHICFLMRVNYVPCCAKQA